MKIEILAHFHPIFDIELKGKRSQTKLKIIQLELMLEPDWFGFITTRYRWSLIGKLGQRC